MDALHTFMAETEAAISEQEARITALENVITRMSGARMESDPSKLPVVVFENTDGAAVDGNH